MKFVAVLLAAGAVFIPYLCHADEEYAPLVYNGEISESVPYAEETVLASPRLMDEEDLDFDNLNFDAMGDPINLSATPQMTKLPQTEAPKAPEQPVFQVDKNKTLTDNLQANANSKIEDAVIPLPPTDETWISKLKSPLSESADETDDEVKDNTPSLSRGKINLESLVEKSKKTVRRSNASVFDISGAMLRMSFQQVDDILTRRGYRRTMQKLDVPNFIRWRNEDQCRASGVVGYERLENCVLQKAKKDGHQYVERAMYSKFKTREEIEVRFTSTFTNNKAYRISYKSEAATSISGNSQKQIYLRNIKVYDFWKKINQKYGTPDNKDDVIWGLGGNKPYLQAGTGRLVLEDPMLRELDYTRMSREDQKFMNTDLYSF